MPTVNWDLVSSIASFLLSAISIVFVVLTLRQNNRMLEAASRPYIGVSSSMLNNGVPLLELIVKNYGASAARITKLQSSIDLSRYTLGEKSCRPFADLEGTSLMPGQSLFTGVDYSEMEKDGVRSITFTIDYVTEGKKAKQYRTVCEVGIMSNAALVHARYMDDGNPLKAASYALQGIVERLQ